MYEKELAVLCKRLRLSSNLADNAQTISGSNHQDYLVNLLTAELNHRQKSRRDRLIKEAGFYTVKTIGDFIADDVQFPVEIGLDELAELSFIKEKHNIIMYGGTGTGKTHLSTALGVEACSKGFTVGFYRTTALVNKLSDANANGTLTKLKAKLDKQELLILDEWGYVPLDITGAQLLYDVIAECYEQKPIILNTNIEFSGWGNILYDRKLAAALLTRLLHHCHLLIFNGQDMRLKQSSINKTMYSALAYKREEQQN